MGTEKQLCGEIKQSVLGVVSFSCLLSIKGEIGPVGAGLGGAEVGGCAVPGSGQ